MDAEKQFLTIIAQCFGQMSNVPAHPDQYIGALETLIEDAQMVLSSFKETSNEGNKE